MQFEIPPVEWIQLSQLGLRTAVTQDFTACCLSRDIGFSSGSMVKIQLPMQEMQERQVQFPSWEDPPEVKWQPNPILLPGKSHGQRNLEHYNPWGHKESGVTERLVLMHIAWPNLLMHVLLLFSIASISLSIFF